MIIQFGEEAIFLLCSQFFFHDNQIYVHKFLLHRHSNTQKNIIHEFIMLSAFIALSLHRLFPGLLAGFCKHQHISASSIFYSFSATVLSRKNTFVVKIGWNSGNYTVLWFLIMLTVEFIWLLLLSNHAASERERERKRDVCEWIPAWRPSQYIHTYIYIVQRVNCRLNYAKMKITLTSHFIWYIFQNYLKILKYCRLNLFKEITLGFNRNLQTTSEFPLIPSDVLFV